jgi:hypothetical protein
VIIEILPVCPLCPHHLIIWQLSMEFDNIVTYAM